ncbi:Mut7-C ubiquitin/RNAse domain-containing protein [Streptomyces sp. JJ36]|uniref:Mut7-C ubiquitin/RNAse domain-containing protein n=1 Tax=Streptomyces sp. JJ36 TaxID=2736645 RepID=UPI001F411C4E|nr:Mut7-C ubiquitin/RNAse domain-containing protein [Streptomyces sp. JJ36]MCF6521509.1 hypothetical protein [Streptomyces sp. JJ36]
MTGAPHPPAASAGDSGAPHTPSPPASPPAPPATLRLRFPEELRFFLPARHRGGEVDCRTDGTSTLGHLVESLGVPLTEVGAVRADGGPVPLSQVAAPGAELTVQPVARPQPVPHRPPRFLLDVHLGALARRLRLVGVDTAYGNDLDDEALLARANAEHRVLLTQDRGLLRRRALWLGGYVHGSRPDAQLTDVLDRFAPPLAPWTRCLHCNGPLEPVAKSAVAHRLPPGTRRTYDTFTRCRACDRLYWPGAHHARLAERVAAARAAAAG